MQQAFIRVTPTHQSWHSIGDAAGVRRILRLWDVLLVRRHLAELPDNDHIYSGLQHVMRGGVGRHVRLVRELGSAFDAVAVCTTRLRELTESLEWLHCALVSDHEYKYVQVDGEWVVMDEVDDPPCTDLSEAQRTAESIDAILDEAYLRLVLEDE